MDVNLPVWNYYPKNDEPFLDPLYAPYQYKDIPSSDGVNGTCPVNTWAKNGCPGGMFNPDLVRKGWGQSFQLMFPSDPCPPGWTKGTNGNNYGWCVREQPEFGDNGLYSKDAFVPYYQYFYGYASPHSPPKVYDPLVTPSSINPYTGNFVEYIKANQGKNSTRYLHIPSKDSYLA